MMRSALGWWSQLPDIFHALAGTLFIMIPISPLFMPFIRRDAGVFLYVGWRMLSGEVPYRDVWDHKPPLILWLNSVGLALGNGSRWGVWLVEFLILLTALVIALKLLKNAFGTLPAIVGTYLWLLGMTGLISGGNYTTEYALPLQFGCYWLFYEAEKRKKNFWPYYWTGILCGLAFFTKQNTIGVGIAILLYLLITRSMTRQGERMLINLGAIVGGAGTVLVGVALLFARQQALTDLWEATFIYNFSYVAAGILEHIESTIKGMIFLSGLTVFACLGWVLYLLLFVHRIRLPRMPSHDAGNLLTLGLINFPIELMLVGTSGNPYRHYYLTLLPVFALFTSFVFWAVLNQVRDPGPSPRWKKYLYIVPIAFYCLSLITAAVGLFTDLDFPSRRAVDFDEATNYLRQHTTHDDYVLMWGAESALNFSAERRSPSRFSYQYPLYLEGYTSPGLIEEFLEDIVRNKPVLIIDTRNPRTPLYDFKVMSPRIMELRRILKGSYKFVENLGPWVVYKYVGSPD